VGVVRVMLWVKVGGLQVGVLGSSVGDWGGVQVIGEGGEQERGAIRLAER
jgi:hypothetical protein